MGSEKEGRAAASICQGFLVRIRQLAVKVALSKRLLFKYGLSLAGSRDAEVLFEFRVGKSHGMAAESGTGFRSGLTADGT